MEWSPRLHYYVQGYLVDFPLLAGTEHGHSFATAIGGQADRLGESLPVPHLCDARIGSKKRLLAFLVASCGPHHRHARLTVVGTVFVFQETHPGRPRFRFLVSRAPDGESRMRFENRRHGA